MGLIAESVKEIVGDHDGLHVLRIAVTGHVVFGAAPEGLVAGDFLEGLRVAREFFVGTDVIGGAGKAAFAVVAGEPDELLGMRERERTEEQSVDDAEDDDVGADAESEDEDGDGGEGAILAKGAEGVAKILRENFDERDGAGIEVDFFGLLRAAELDERLAAGFFVGTAGEEFFFDGEVEVVTHFGGQFAIELVAAEEREQSGGVDEGSWELRRGSKF